MNTGILFDIEHSSFVDGPGIRTTVFFKGCNLKCAWCHNPESQEFKPQMMFYRDKCTGCGKCKEICPNSLEKCDFCGKCEIYCPVDARRICGKEYTADQVIEEVARDKCFYDNSGGGVTFSGGECMLQLEFLAELLQKAKEKEIHTAVDTAGHLPWESFAKILPFTNLFLYDMKCFNSERHKEYIGVGNELILENLAKLLKLGKDVIVRIPLIPGVNDFKEEMLELKKFFETNGKPQRVELLPYHAMGENKYPAIGRAAKVFTVPEKEKTEELKKIFAW